MKRPEREPTGAGRMVGVFLVLGFLGAGATTGIGSDGPAAAELETRRGTLSLDLLPLFRDAGLRLDTGGIQSTTPFSRRDDVAFELAGAERETALGVEIEGRSFSGFGTGSLRHRGEGALGWAGGEAGLAGLELRGGSGKTELELVDGAGRQLFLLDHAHPSVGSEPPVLRLENMDLRIAGSLANRMGRPRLAGAVVGRATVILPLAGQLQATAGAASGCVEDFSGVVNVELTEISSLSQVVSSDGKVAFAPAVKLTNTGTAAVPWYRSIVPDGCGDSSCVGEHPYLVLNAYRIAGDRLEQIGRSGVKHAFYAANTGCPCDHGQVLFPDCSDSYGVDTNADRLYLAPREEVRAGTGEWSSLGSHFDGSPVDDRRDHFGETDDFTHRLWATEADLGVAGARYFVEAWYVVPGDVDIFDSMGRRELDPVSGTPWTFSFVDAGVVPGSVVDEWVDPDTPEAGERNETVTANGGHLQLAVRARELGDGFWRYEIALANHDFDRKIRSLAIPAAGATIRNLHFSNGDGDPDDDWKVTIGDRTVTWSTSSEDPEGNALGWGTLFSFGLEADLPPVDGEAILEPLETGDPLAISISALAPDGTIFTDGFESGGVAHWTATGW